MSVAEGFSFGLAGMFGDSVLFGRATLYRVTAESARRGYCPAARPSDPDADRPPEAPVAGPITRPDADLVGVPSSPGHGPDRRGGRSIGRPRPPEHPTLDL